MTLQTDPDALRALVLSEKDRPQPISRLGYFCAPFRPRSGPLSDRVIKIYRSPGDAETLQRLVSCHADYVAALIAAGVALPDTEMQVVNTPAGPVPVIVQEALPETSLMRPLMKSESLEQTLVMMEGAGAVIATFWTAVQNSDTRIGFHPSIRNFAWHEEKAVFFDTFPPLIHYTRAEMGRMLLTYSEKRLMRLVGPLLQNTVTAIQDEWYSPPETLVGLVGSACRLRPDDAAAYLDWGRDFTRRRMQPWAEEALAGLDRPPRLPGYWTGFRKILGLQGEPNI
ncbi:DUF6206 family protein [Cognatishimia sp. F0-27]|uniref:DUF6206 family protein n=1 Tax=Cognatishimia sp. F0-27 TaxID=2816855 RepID=UPI001D0C6F61|nr:DUF6206 family protein [Cognatishimia sp. F0-27]MCC1492829.1 hypothetical protein [Cognatishimia sp. F0-27]